MMGLMVEEVGHQQPERSADLAVGGAAEPGAIFGEPGVVDLAGPARDVPVGLFALGTEHGEILDHAGALLDRGGRLRPAVKARHPLLVAPQDVGQRAVDRAPEAPRGIRRSVSESRAAAR